MLGMLCLLIMMLLNVLNYLMIVLDRKLSCLLSLVHASGPKVRALQFTQTPNMLLMCYTILVHDLDKGGLLQAQEQTLKMLFTVR